MAAAVKKAQKISWKEILIRYIWIVIGAAIYTFGLDVLMVPKNIIDGGVVGIALMATELTGVSFSIYLILLNLPFLYFGYKLIGRSFTIATLFGVVCISVMSLFMHQVTPPDIDPFLAAVFGGVILGIGVGLIIRNGGSLDGVEIVAIIWDKKSSFSVGEIVMICNLFILGAAGFVYNWSSAMYSLIAYFVAYKMIDLTITGLEESKGVMIITDSPDEISEVLMNRLGRGVTVLFGEGGYSKEPKKVLYSVVTRLEITKLKDIVYEQDENAFITISDVHDVFGGQFGKKNIH
ncbi:MAG: YitT family protein [Veillonella sp.]|uniref:YitT family protein n=1 Tax=Veillonella sp. TaxID=1926307 RepID=UPI0025D8552B|nr:YitT family protein [Veillonella sp.]MBS4913603.1 YitT family protein [Veillonella sp.]